MAGHSPHPQVLNSSLGPAGRPGLWLWSSYLVKPDDMWMAKHLHYLYFPENLLQVFIIQLGLIYDFNSNLATEEENVWMCY